MKVLVLNGSPKASNSNTMKVTDAFLEGLTVDGEHSVEIVHIVEKTIGHCTGCYYCWTYTPGRCVLRDDMTEVLQSYLTADLVIWSSPIHSFGISSLAKMLLDRLLPVYLPIIEERRDDGAAHPFRFDLSYQKYLLIATCGFYAYENNVEAVHKQFDIMYGESIDYIVCPEGDLFAVPQLRYRTKEYLSSARQAGRDWAQYGKITESTREQLRVKHYIPEEYMTMANMNWQVFEKGTPRHEILRRRIQVAMIQMKMVFEPESLKATQAVMEMRFDDDLYCCQFVMDENGCSIIEDENCYLPYHLRVITTFGLWEQISKKGMSILRGSMSQPSSRSDFHSLISFVSALAERGHQKTLRL